jgi:curved DNA-binding protein CbpA
MKDYYKILGLKGDASVDEIRERWIELMKHYHPDLGNNEGKDEKIKEVNEAYQTLKFSSTRIPYDLKRTHDRQKRRSSVRRIIVTVAIPVLISVAFILTALFLKKPHVSLESKDIPSTGHDSESVQQSPPEAGAVASIEEAMPSESKTSVEVKTPKRDSRTMATIEEKKIAAEEAEPVADPPRAEPGIPENLLPSPVETDPVRQTNITARADRTDPSAPAPNAGPSPKAPESGEEEVKQFYANYIKCYTKKDIDGFLSCFSSKAYQNRRAGLDEIRKIYANFFNLSQELRYRVEGMKIAFNQGYTEVSALYEVYQVLGKGGEVKTWRGDIRWTLVREEGDLKILSLDYRQQTSP